MLDPLEGCGDFEGVGGGEEEGEEGGEIHGEGRESRKKGWRVELKRL